MAVVRSPFAQNVPALPQNAPVDQENLTPSQRLARIAAERGLPDTGVTRSPLSDSSGGGNVYPREITQSDLRAREQQILGSLRDARQLKPGDVASTREKLSAAALGGDVKNEYTLFHRTAGKALSKGLSALGVPAKATQAFLGSIPEAIGQAGRRTLAKSMGAQGTGAPGIVQPTGPPVTGFRGRYEDPEYFLRIPNIRDQFDQSDFGPFKISRVTGLKPLDAALTTGMYAIDLVAETGLQVGLDPVTYFTLGASKFVGAAGRAALATRVLKKDVLEKAPTIATKIDDVIRYGEWALDDAERAVLVNAGILQPKGFGYTFGTKTVPKTGAAAQALGQPFAKARAAVGDVIGDLPVTGRVQQMGIPQSRRMLEDVARGRVTGQEAVDVVVRYAGTRAAKAAGQSANQILTGRHLPLLRALVDSPYVDDIAGAIEPGVTGARKQLPTPEAQQLADDTSAAFADIQSFYNERLAKFADDYGLQPEFVAGIANIDDYFFHTITDDSIRWIRSQKNRTSGFLPEIEQNIAVSPSELGRGGGPLRARKLKAGEGWLGETLKSGSIEEINEISMRKLGFNWFKTDAAEVMQSYINSVTDQVKRLAFMDRLFDYGPEYVRPILGRVVPDPAILKPTEKAVSNLYAVRAKLLRAVEPTVTGVQKQLQRSVRVATNIVEKGERALDLREAAVAKLRPELEQSLQRIATLRKSVESQAAHIRGAYEDILVPMEARLRALVSAIDDTRGAREVARQQLIEEHVRLYPGVSDRARTKLSLSQLAAQVSERTAKQYDQKIRALETRVRKRRAGAETEGARAGRAEARVARLAVEPEGERESLDFLRTLRESEPDLETTPEGMVFTLRSTIDQASPERPTPVSGSSAETLDAAFSLGDDVVVFPAPHKNLVFRPHEDLVHFNEMTEVLPEVLGEYILDMGLSGRRAENLSFALRSNGQGSELLPDVDADFVNALLAARRAEFIDPDSFNQFYDEVVVKFSRVVNDLNVGANADDIAETMLNRAMLDAFDGDVSERVIADLLASPYGEKAFANVGFPIVHLPSREFVGDFDVFVSDRALKNFLRTNPDRAFDSSSPVWNNVIGQDPLSAEMAVTSGRAARTESVQVAGAEAAAARAASEQAAAEAATAGRQLGGTRSASRRAEERVSSLRSTALERDPLVEAAGQPTAVPLTEATKESKAQERAINKLRNDLDVELQADPALKALESEEIKYRKLGTRFDAAESIAVDKQTWMNEVAPLYVEDISSAVNLINSAPPKGAAGRTAGEWARRAEEFTNNLNALDLSPQEREAYDRVFTQLFGLEAELAQAETGIMMGQQMINAINSGEFGTVLQKEILTGWREISNLGVQVPAEFLDDLASSVARLNNPAEWKNWTRHYFTYQKFFKSWAIATPGFTVRNAMTAAFNNFVAGVSPSDTAAGVRFAANNFKRNRGGPDYALSQVPAAERELYQKAYEAVSASGGGQAIDELMPLLRGQGSRLYNNPVTRGSQRVNEAAEIGARMGMALDGIRKGLDVDAAAARIARYQFDYSDLSQLDMIAKSFIPFWVFAVRNIPLQLTNQFMRPSMYRTYEKLKDAEADANDQFWPGWLRDREPIKLGGNKYLNLDLPQVEMAEQIRNLLSGKKLLSMANPLFRVPIEGVRGRSVAFDAPYSSQPRQVGLTDIPSAAVAQLLSLLGVGEGVQRGPEGGLFISDWEQQIGPNVIPVIQQLQRILKPVMAGLGADDEMQRRFGGSPRYAERDPSTVLGSYFGIPVGQVTQEQVEGEMRRRRYDLDAIRQEIVDRSKRVTP